MIFCWKVKPIHHILQQSINLNCYNILNCNLQNMQEQEHNFCLFQACLSPGSGQKEAIISSPKELRSISRKQIKVSLKHNKQQSMQSYASTRNGRSNFRKDSENIERISQSGKENKFSNTSREFNSQFQRKLDEKLPLNGMFVKGPPMYQSPENFQFITLNDSKSKGPEEEKLQRTTKISSPILKQSIKSNHLQNLELQKTKILKKDNFIKHLDSFRSSVMSIHFENEPLHEKLEESVIMVDYFHPAEKKVLELQNYLVNRK